MKKIKISTITILACYGIANAFLLTIPMWLGISMSAISLAMFVWLNIEAFKTRGTIKRLVLWANLVLALFVVVTLSPNWEGTYFVVRYFMSMFTLVFAGLVVAILVNSYLEPSKR